MRPLDGQHAQKNLIEQGKDSRVGANSQRKCNDHREGESRRLAQLAKRVTKILQKRIHSDISLFSAQGLHWINGSGTARGEPCCKCDCETEYTNCTNQRERVKWMYSEEH